jgi:hypothetical protein
MTMKLELSKIRLDGGTQSREMLSPEWIEKYAQDLRSGIKFDPIEVVYDGTDYWCWDGFHRCTASRQAKIDSIEAHVVQGTLEDAQWYSLSANKKHGIPRSNRDKTRAVLTALAHPKGKECSNVQIAEHCGVSEFLVRKCRKKKDSEPSSIKSKMRTVTRRGTTFKQNASRIGSGKKKSSRPRSSTEYLQARQEGREARPSCFVKLELPNNNVRNCAYDLLKYFTFEYLEKVFSEIINIHQQ